MPENKAEHGAIQQTLLETLLTRAKAVRENAHAPYSQFMVGAALLDGDGNIYSGCNVENAAYPEGLCAEAAAIAAMVAAGGREIKQICIVADKKRPVGPCGGCRQKIQEFGQADTRIYLCDTHEIKAEHQLSDLLPHSFSARDLDK
jgi:cytidine deaminase